MKNRKTYAGAFKAKVVTELICGRRCLAELAAQYDLHPNQIKNWKATLLKQASTTLEDKRRTRKRSE